jgi:hypothetical protein
MMPNRHPFLFVLVVVFAAGLVGCSRGEARQVVAFNEPDEAVRAVAQGIADGKPEVAWLALPPSYRQDVTDLVHASAAKMDAEVWNKSFSLVQKVTRLLREKREFILDHPMLAQNLGDRSETEAGWDAMVGLFDTLANSDLSDINKTRVLDVESFLRDTGGELMRQATAAASLAPDGSWSEQMANLRNVQTEVVSRDEDSAVVRVTRPGAQPAEHTYVQVEGYWIPKEIADGWSAKIAEARHRIDQVAAGALGAENKPAVLMQLSMFEGAVDSLLAAGTAEQFNAGLGSLMGMAMGAAMTQVIAEPPPNQPSSR